MQRNTGALASLTATYDSDDSDIGSEDENAVEAQIPAGNSTTAGSPPFRPANDEFFNKNIRKDTTYDTESGHITDEELNSNSDKEDYDLKEDDDVNDPPPIVPALNLREMAPTIGDVTIPPEPPGRASNHLQDKISQYYEKMMRDNLDMNYQIQNQKKFRNPSIYEKLIQYCQIDELGTNYTPDIYDPKQFGPTSYYEELAKAQKVEMDRRQKEQKERTKVEFITGTAKRPASGDISGGDEKKRKSKWDVGAGALPKHVVAAPTVIGVPPVGLASINTAQAGAKAMVISAYGTITKKTKQ